MLTDSYERDIPDGPGPWDNFARLIEANEASGNYWFSPDTITFFDSRYGGTHGGLYAGRFFISSEKGPDKVRRYTIRVANDDASISTFGRFGGYSTLRSAESDIKLITEGRVK